MKTGKVLIACKEKGTEERGRKLVIVKMQIKWRKKNLEEIANENSDGIL